MTKPLAVSILEHLGDDTTLLGLVWGGDHAGIPSCELRVPTQDADDVAAGLAWAATLPKPPHRSGARLKDMGWRASVGRKTGATTELRLAHDGLTVSVAQVPSALARTLAAALDNLIALRANLALADAGDDHDGYAVALEIARLEREISGARAPAEDTFEEMLEDPALADAAPADFVALFDRAA